MTDNPYSASTASPGRDAVPAVISIVQRGNLKVLEETLRKQWRLGQNMVLCWGADERGLLVILVPHYFLGNYSATVQGSEGGDNEHFVQELLSGRRRKSREDLLAIAERLGVSPTFIKLNSPLEDEPPVLEAVEQLIRRYGLGFVPRRAVLLFDIVDFSLHTPFEQASQLNSLSYSMNSAYNKLLAQGIEINFARTTTGDGYYVWNRDLGPYSHQDLFFFMVLVVADNAIARAASRGKTVPRIRSAFHIGSHYELYQAEGINPTVFSYIVGDVTIELARMLDFAQPGQILVGEFDWAGENGVGATPAFVRHCNLELETLKGLRLSRKEIHTMHCRLSTARDEQGQPMPRQFRITDKHGFSRQAYNLEVDIETAGGGLRLGLTEAQLPGGGPPANVDSDSAPALAGADGPVAGNPVAAGSQGAGD